MVFVEHICFVRRAMVNTVDRMRLNKICCGDREQMIIECDGNWEIPARQWHRPHRNVRDKKVRVCPSDSPTALHWFRRQNELFTQALGSTFHWIQFATTQSLFRSVSGPFALSDVLSMMTKCGSGGSDVTILIYLSPKRGKSTPSSSRYGNWKSNRYVWSQKSSHECLDHKQAAEATQKY